jgi:hypothetical protein
MYCDGFNAIIVSDKTCSIPITSLTIHPYNLLKGNSVLARIIAANEYGDSDYSLAGNGAYMIIVPDAPILLLNDLGVTNRNQIGFTWSEGYSNGGYPVLDYQVFYD